MRYPLRLAALIGVSALAGLCTTAAGAGDASAQLRLLSEGHDRLQSQLAALREPRARVGSILSELPDQVRNYGNLQSALGIDDDVLVSRIVSESQEARALPAEDGHLSAVIGQVKSDLTQLLSDSTQHYPQLGGVSARGNTALAISRLPPPAASNGSISKLLACGGAAFDGSGGCAGSAAPGIGRRSTAAALTQTPHVAHGLLSGGNAHLDRAPPGIDDPIIGAGSTRRPPILRTAAAQAAALANTSAGDDMMPRADGLLAAQLKGILAHDGKAFNARDYLARYASMAAGHKSDPAGLAAWEKEVKAYLQFKDGNHLMRGVQRGLALIASPASALGAKPDTAVAEACWRALARQHPNYAQGCADNPKMAAVMSGVSQAVVDQVKGLASPQALILGLGALLLGGLASGGVADVIALLLAVGFTAYMIWKILSDYGPRLVSAVRDLVFSKSGSVESFQKWRDASYYLTTTLVAVAMIYLGAKGVASLSSKLAAAAKGTTAAEAIESSGVAAAAESGAPARAASSIFERATAAEPRITAQVQAITQENGGKLVGLENRLKTLDSLTRKIETDILDKNINATQAAGEIGDAVRYTSVLPEKSFASGVQVTLENLEAKGYAIVKYKNTFGEGNIYKGINCQLRSPSGQPFELQFHTQASFDLKTALHGDFEIYRDPKATLAARQAAFDRMRAAFSRVQAPVGAEFLGKIMPLPVRP